MEKVQLRAKKNNSGLQGFELWGKVEKVWTISTGVKKEQRSLIETYTVITGKKALWDRFFELTPDNKVTLRQRYNFFKKPKGTLGKKFFRAEDLWNVFYDSTVLAENLSAFKGKLGELSY